MARRRSRRYQQGETQVERGKRYPVDEGIALIKSLNGPKFDESVDVAIRIGIDPIQITAPFLGQTPSGMVHGDPPHGLCDQAEEMLPVLPGPAGLTQQPQIGFVDQRGGGQRHARPLASELPSRQPPQIRIDQFQQPLHGVLVAVATGEQQLGDLGG